MRNRTLISSGLALAALAAVGTSLIAHRASASSHREAPFITKNPKVDGTDFYMFKSYETGRAGFVTLIANYVPLQDPGGGPNFFNMDPEALYEIHLDNTGDAKQDITFQFRFQSNLAATKVPVGSEMVAIPLVNSGPVTGDGIATPANANVSETYTVQMLKGDAATGTVTDVVKASDGTKVFQKPLDYIGQKSFGAPAAYEAYARKHIFDVKLDGCATNARVFVGQRKETFAVNIGVIFDLVNVDYVGGPGAAGIDQPLGTAIGAGSNRAAFPNPLAGKNITSIEMEVPISCVTGTATAATGAAAAANKIIGGWTTASVRQARVINPGPTFAKPTVEGGAWAQVSRLGFPLINEAVIGLPDKDKFNSSIPSDDLANFADYVTHPTLPVLLQAVLGAANYSPPPVPRDDMVAVAVTGVSGVNMPVNTGAGAGEMTRLNVNDAFVPKPIATQFALGAAGCFLGMGSVAGPTYGFDSTNTACDPNGFPNGRRPLDDVTDIVLSVVGADFLRTPYASKHVLHDGVAEELGFRNNASPPVASSPALDMFPYLPTPNGGT